MGRDSFPRQQARTRRFALGAPGSFAVASDGSRVAFIRSRAGDDPVGCLWTLDVERAEELLVFDPAELAAEGEGRLSQQERDRRERARELLTGVTSYGADPLLRVAAFVVGERLFAADLVEAKVRELVAAAPAFDPRPDPTARRLAYVVDGALHVLDLASGDDREVAADDDPDVHRGLAEFVAAEEMDRRRGFWWSPDGERLAVARADERPVAVWHIASPIDPAAPPRAVRYPQAGTANAIVTLSVVGATGGREIEVAWDREAFPYLARVTWNANGPLTLLVQSRDQRRWQVLAADPDAGETTLIREDRDEAWLHILDGVPDWLDDGRLVFAADLDDTRRLLFEGEPVTPPGLQVERVVHVGEGAVVEATDEPTELHLWSVGGGGAVERVTREPGVHRGAAAADVLVRVSATLDADLPETVVLKGGEPVATIASLAERPVLLPRPTFFRGGALELRCALLTPGGAEPVAKLPVLLDPYGGPHANRVVAARSAFGEPQWFADQGFGVLVADGRGTDRRGPSWERAIHRSVAEVVLQDQVDALHAAGERFAFLDLERVGIRGWSFGGYLAALAVLRRPDVFHAAISGAPVTDWRLYDTHYTERYLGHPGEDPDAYARSSIVDDAGKLERPLLLIHGVADDNVYVANTLRLSRALMEAGRLHSVLPLSGVTHLAQQEEVAENLLLLQVRFLKDALGIS